MFKLTRDEAEPMRSQTVTASKSDLYERLTSYDDEPWTDDEMDALAAEVDEMLDDDMAIEDPQS
jgi:hypothetical protein